MRKVAVVLVLVSVGLLFVQFVGLTPTVGNTDDLRFAQKVNLALRRTAHHLLAEKGDSISRIPPVQQLNTTVFRVRLEQPFDYGRLPTLLEQSLAIHGINGNYDVTVLDCVSGELQLGYNFLDLRKDSGVPCVGRKQGPGCYNLQLVFTAPTTQNQPGTVWGAGLLGFLLLGGAYVFWIRANKESNKSITLTNDTVPNAGMLIRVGQLTFSNTNQVVTVAGVQHTLTYREAKLLHLFMRHPNQLLERDFILKSVWEDEGIIVGRSVDVFVSRLRKLLQTDPAVRIVAVHGVGYRLEVTLIQGSA
ncbi:response regulator transcription factor [Spirosoma agri]|uniref:Response regulator transcription factor n=2 Tax=Spirosoma agri TaxID=1987381 RepID=A0A6M0ILQ7_9BACT|nr:response regulator transcription factor [Spirosoma agri]